MSNLPCGRRRRAGALLVAVALAAAAACSAGSDSTSSSAAEGAANEAQSSTIRILDTYQAFVLASAENNPLFADVYGLRFDPLVVHRITTDKRVSSLGADKDHVIVAAADQDVDRLAVVDRAGGLSPVPGLGRPFAYTPAVVDGVMYYDDFVETRNGDVNRYLAWDLAKRKKTLLFKTTEELSGNNPVGEGRFILLGPASPGDEIADAVQIRTTSEVISRSAVGGDSIGFEVGRDWVATTLAGAGDRFGDQPETLVLVGRTKRIPGLQAICWTPDGKRLLARRTTSATDSQLVLVNPAKPDAARELETVRGLVIYSGVWVRGASPS